MGQVYTYVYIIPQKKKALERFSRLVSCALSRLKAGLQTYRDICPRVPSNAQGCASKRTVHKCRLSFYKSVMRRETKEIQPCHELRSYAFGSASNAGRFLVVILVWLV